MSRAKLALSGARFGMLVVLEEANPHGVGSWWLCRCDCGTEKVLRGGNLSNGTTTSCGCLSNTANRRRRLAARRRRPFDNGDGTWSVPLTQGQTAIISEQDAPLIAAHNWAAEKPRGASCWYAFRSVADDTGKVMSVKMHREIMAAASGQQVDHINGNGLDNRRANLRFATSSQNSHNSRISVRNRSGVRGVHWSSLQGQWCVQIGHEGRTRHVGFFDRLEDAAAARRAIELELHGEYACDIERAVSPELRAILASTAHR